MANADIGPPKDFLDSHPNFAALLVNTALEAQFARAEATATQAKSIYTVLGVVALGGAGLTMTALVYALTLNSSLVNKPAFALFLGAVGFIGIVAQIGLLATPIKRRWLVSRYEAERLRGIKFQAFAAAAAAGPAFAQAAHKYVAEAIARLAVELDRPRAAMQELDPDEIELPSPGHARLPAALFEELKDIYRILRIDYQINHAKHCINQINEERRLPASASEIAFWFAVGLGFLDFVLAALGIEAWSGVRHFFALFSFVLSAILFVFERGRSHNEALERYEDYAGAMRRVAVALQKAKDVEAFVDCICRSERAAMRELKIFCREATKSTYLF